MSLDRQKILSELGSVMNQLKSADCGCMGKLFGDSGQGNPVTEYNSPTCFGCRGSCCHGHGDRWNSCRSCDETYTNNTKHLYRPCMGQCDPPKLYADTYNYLNKNLMQPTVNEVYSDLKGLTPANTIMNNPIANRMGLSRDGSAGQGQSINMNSMPVNDVNRTNPMGGMGPQIINMLGGNLPQDNTLNEQTRQLSGPLSMDAPQSFHNQMGVTPISAPTINQMSNNNRIIQSNAPNVNQTTMQPYETEKIQNNMNFNPTAQQMPIKRHHPHGQHVQGTEKFNEMFPGVIKGLGGDLGFDPMAIAIQMNPANKQQAAMDTMHKMMQNNTIEKVFAQPVLNTGQDGVTAPTATSNLPSNQMQNNMQPNRIDGLNDSIQQEPINLPSTPQPHVKYPDLRKYQNVNKFQANDPNTHNYRNFETPANNQQIYNMESGETKQQMFDYPNGQTQLRHTIIDPNVHNVTRSPILSKGNEIFTHPSNNPTQHANRAMSESLPPQQIIKEPIFPADSSNFRVPKQKYYAYNTLGQPVEMLSAKTYHTPEPALPQTLSPQTVQKYKTDPSKYSTVKSTVSKTSLIGNGARGNPPNNLQQLYNHYKGSQSYTHQNIGSVVKPATHSEGKLNTAPTNSAPANVTIEKFGGDSTANNQVHYQTIKKYEQGNEHIAEVSDPNKPTGDSVPDKIAQVNNRKCRNGLQDIVYTSYPSSAAWSFHGPDKAPYFAGYRYRKKY